MGKKSLKVVDYVKSLNEWALVNKVEDSLSANLYKVYIYGNDRDNFTPHFHFFDNAKTFHLEISLIDAEKLIILKSAPKKGVDKKDLNTWKGLKKEKGLLHTWLLENSKRMEHNTNKEALLILWDFNNPDNEISNYLKKY